MARERVQLICECDHKVEKLSKQVDCYISWNYLELHNKSHTVEQHIKAYPNEKLWVLAKSCICCRTTSIPLSSDAFSSKIILWYCAPYSLRATARIVDVFPVPGGPYSRRWGNLFSLVSLSTTQPNKTKIMILLERHYNTKYKQQYSIFFWLDYSTTQFHG